MLEDRMGRQKRKSMMLGRVVLITSFGLTQHVVNIDIPSELP